MPDRCAAAMSTTPDRARGPSSSHAPLEDGPYVLRSLLDDVPLAADGLKDPVTINCVEYFDGNLYVGTSASELLHFVQIPPDPAEKSAKPVFILASRLSPAFSAPTGAVASPPQPGVQHILLLPSVGKACVLCNWTVTFYSLPELSPVSGTGQVKNCSWIGGTDLNEASETTTDVTILLSLKRRIQVVRVGESARAFKNIDYAGSTLSIRRDSIACVADSKSYALLDIERQLKIPLMSISSLDEPPPPGEVGQAQSIAADAVGGIVRSASSAENRPHSVAQSHSRSKSLGGAILGNIRRQEPPTLEEGSSTLRRASPPTPSTSPRPLPPPPPDPATAALSADKQLPAEPSEAMAANPVHEPQPGQQLVSLKPHIASPSPEEFLVVIGTSPSEPGIGMFVNLDGDATRATIEFECYPTQVVTDGTPTDPSSPRSRLPGDEEGYVLASMVRQCGDKIRYGLEIQRWSAGNESSPAKHWLAARDVTNPSPYGIRSLVGQGEIQFEEVVGKLSQGRFVPFANPIDASTPSLRSLDSRTASLERLHKEKESFERDDSQDDESLPEGWEATRLADGEEFARRLAKTDARLAVWAGDRIWWAARNPLILQLDTDLDAACPEVVASVKDMDKQGIYSVLEAIRGRDVKTELQFLTFGYLRQKAGLLLLVELLTSGTEQLFESELSALEEILMESKLDARVVLSLVPGLRNEIVEGRLGIWIYGGVRKVADAFLLSAAFDSLLKAGLCSLGSRAMHFLRRFLSSWRRMKGFASVSDESEVFRTVDAALLTVLLELDRHAPKGLGKGGSVRSELNDLVDRGVSCFERAIDLLESYHRLFVLSRLYQSRKMAGDVLATWRRIIEGERDEGQELRDGEQRVREYLAKVSSQALVEEYGVWLANRNPRLGVQVFAEDKSRACEFEPARVVELLREEAPDAIKFYLEHLVFGKGNTAYVKELIAYYLDVVLNELEACAASREAVMAAYDAYRALRSPKPTYHHFLTANAPEGDETWQSRLRLLQLLGGPHDYDSAAICSRIARLSGELLVPETIILAGREQHHDDALRLLVHNLGDYDTAVAYCLRGGTSVYVPPEGRGHDGASAPKVEQQRRLLRVVLHEFLAIADADDRVEQTGALLEHLGGWFDAEEVLRLVPDSWPVDVVAGFLVGALKRLVRDKHESVMTRALSGAENVRVNYDLIVGMDEKGPTVEVLGPGPGGCDEQASS